jgi:epoxyqueuosine reductase
MNDLASFINEFRAEAERLGFSLVGVTNSDPPEHFPVYQAWIEAGNQAGMSYLSNPINMGRRARPSLIMPECHSIIVLGLPYPNPIPYPTENKSTDVGLIAAYAWQEDYHTWILDRGAELVKYLKTHFDPSIKARIFTDSPPILERELAARAGLGWIARNSCLISPEIGSFFLLAEIFTDSPVASSPQVLPDDCGNCRRCIDACPTHCILPDRSIDSRRCISYLTIENKGLIPRELRPLMGNWIFGCDVCQIVCPWNKKQVSHNSLTSPTFSQPARLPILRTELLLTEAEFQSKYRFSPILRPGRVGYLRNIAVALGNQRDDANTELLAQMLRTEPDALIRLHVAWALGRMQNFRAKVTLGQKLKVETNQEVLKEIRLSIREM